jgi:uncharacterized protein (UPF0332 family)
MSEFFRRKIQVLFLAMAAYLEGPETSRTVFKSRFAPRYPARRRSSVKPETLLKKADRALVSADVLFRDGDAEGTCNRSYYAMFNAARAALILVGAPSEVIERKSYSGLHSAFNQYLVKPGHIPQALGAEFRRAERLRQISDHLSDPIESEKVELTLNYAREFVQKVKSELVNSPSVDC